MSDIVLGRTYRDEITGYTGVATARTTYLYDTPSVQPTRADSGGVPERMWIPEAACEPVADGRALGFTPDTDERGTL